MPGSQLRKDLLILALGAGFALDAGAATLFLMSVSGHQVQLVVNGSAARVLRVGETSPEGVRLLEVRGGSAVLQAGGRQVVLGIGQSTMAQALVVLNAQHAAQAGIDLRSATASAGYTANGPVQQWLVTLPRVQIGEVILDNVPAAIAAAAIP